MSVRWGGAISCPRAGPGVGRTSDSELSFFGNDVLRLAEGRVVEYWGASSPGS